MGRCILRQLREVDATHPPGVHSPFVQTGQGTGKADPWGEGPEIRWLSDQPGVQLAPIMVVYNAATRELTAKIVYWGPVSAPVKQGQPIGNLDIYRGEQAVAEVPLFAAENVERGDLPRRAFDAASELMIGLLRAAPKKLSGL